VPEEGAPGKSVGDGVDAQDALALNGS
jgi:hypothetical protein